MKRVTKANFNEDPSQQDIFDIISGEGAIKVQVDVSFTSILFIFLAFIVANIVGRLIIK